MIFEFHFIENNLTEKDINTLKDFEKTLSQKCFAVFLKKNHINSAS